jgi:putative transcription antitermination factor YqgF
VDVGSVRVGVARSDPDGILAVPETTVARSETVAADLARLCTELEARIVYVGLPLTLAGEAGPAAADAEGIATALAGLVEIPVHLIDERLTTVTAQQALHAAGHSTRSSRAVIDQAAAVAILEHALAAERAAGTPAGRAVTV